MSDVLVGSISGVIAALIGSLLTARLSYRFQDLLQTRQMEMQK